MTPSANQLSILFPGQGSQAVGMGVALAEEYPVARAVFDEVDEALGQYLFELMAKGPSEELTLTRNTQPALMAVSIAAFRVLQDAGLGYGTMLGMAGHSLGEYSAYCAAGSISLTDTAKLLRLRGEAMQSAVPVGEGAMAAILGLDMDHVIAICDETGAEIANDNSPGQVVISGAVAAVDAACQMAKDHGAKRALKLPVSAPFHCTLMKPAQEAMAEALNAATISAPEVPIYSNVLAAPVTDPDMIRQTLTEQVTGKVRWTETIKRMEKDGTRTFIEVGAGKVLTGLVKRIADDSKAINFGTPADFDNFRDAVAH
ncbi:ACP S-malonyltransferase [Parvularcula sp. LCG005]|uniref:ACP S-malonyltransferase n=1 Tax=Parvularcula sp. LCG005 TaxID=3078805 RepID=UPI0029432A83|nr:ACP S-malonyltransferase [Parvularcula sp. LCG005]WOI54750.1 ACP S-malonyltransferase [Parvularcula sp. LCG005]